MKTNENISKLPYTNDDLLTTKETVHYLKMKPKTLDIQRAKHKSTLPYYQIGQRIR